MICTVRRNENHEWRLKGVGELRFKESIGCMTEEDGWVIVGGDESPPFHESISLSFKPPRAALVFSIHDDDRDRRIRKTSIEVVSNILETSEGRQE